MGTAVLKGLLRDDDRQKWEAWACVRSNQSLDRLRKEFAESECHVSLGNQEKDLIEAVQSADIVLLGCVPSDLSSMLSQNVVQELTNKLIVSMLAGVSVEQINSTIEGKQGQAASVARIIPSMAAAFGQSVTLLATADEHSAEHRQLVQVLLSGIGSTLHVPESDMNTATAIGAACHALMIHAVDAVTDASVADGIPRETAAQLAAQSLNSASFLLTENGGGYTPEALKTAMSTPAGITMNSYLKLHQKQLPSGVADATRSAIAYAKLMAS